MGKEPTSENGPPGAAESTETLSPIIFQILNNLVKYKFQMRLNRNCPLILVLLKEARMKPWVNDFKILPGIMLFFFFFFCCPGYDIFSFLLSGKEKLTEFNKSLSLSINNSKPDKRTNLLWHILLKLFRDVNP